MLNIIGFLLVLLVALLCQKSGGMSNHLLDFGILVLFGGLIGDLARHLRLPSAVGFVLAGILLGNSGLGIIGTSLTSDTSIVESIIFMVLVANLSAAACTGTNMAGCFKLVIAGAIMPAVLFLSGLVIFSLAKMPPRTILLYSLCAATVSPAINTALISNHKHRRPAYIFLLTGFIVTFIGWSLFAAADRTFSGNVVRLALLPVATAVTSVVAGIVWGLAIDTFLPNPSERNRSIFSALVLFLVFPLLREGDLDLLFFAVGFGGYAGLFTSAKIPESDVSGFLALIVFTLFGTRLSLQEIVHVLTLPGDTWRVIGLLFGTIVLGRFLILIILRKIIDTSLPPIKEYAALLSFGPMALVVFHRFVPAFVLQVDMNSSEIDQSVVPVIITTMLLFATSFPIFYHITVLITALRKTHVLDNS